MSIRGKGIRWVEDEERKRKKEERREYGRRERYLKTTRAEPGKERSLPKKEGNGWPVELGSRRPRKRQKRQEREIIIVSAS